MKILIFGTGGAGKSVLAHHLAETRSLAFLELDMIAWVGIDPPRRFPLEESLQKIDAFMEQSSSWVMEGAYGDMIEYLLPHCDEVFFLNPGIEACITNAKNRPWEPHKFNSPEEQKRFLPTLVDWLRLYETRDDEYGLPRHRELFDAFKGKKTEHTDPAAFLRP